MKSRSNYGIVLSLVCSGLVVIISLLKVFDPLELKSLDLRSHWFSGRQKADTNIVIAAIDEISLLQFKHSGVVWKWPREFYGALVRYLHRGGAKAVVFDVLYPDPDIDRANTNGEESDSSFARAMNTAGNVVLASLFHRSDDPLWEDNPLIFKPPYRIQEPYDTVAVRSARFASLPIPLFQQSVAVLGSANYYEDIDGVCRRGPLFYRYHNTIIPHLGLAAYLVTEKIDNFEVGEGQIRLGENVIPLDESGQFRISYYGKGGSEGVFLYKPIGALLLSARDEELHKAPQEPSSQFKNKIVFVGSNAAGLFDLKNSPFSAVEEPYPGVEISATILSNLLQHHYLSRVPSFVVILSILILSLTVGAAFFYLRSPKIAVAATVGLIALWSLAVLMLFSYLNVWLDWVAPMVAVTSTFAVSALVSYQTEGKARRKLRQAFGGYLSPAVVEHVIEKQSEVTLGGAEIKATVLFTDLKDFTSISEKMTAPELIEMLNEYFTLTSAKILDRGGLVDKYIGDAIMAVFGAPLPMADHALLACKAALEIAGLGSDPRDAEDPRLVTRIGINSGKMVVGNVGSNDRHDYTAIGDTVNLASRLEGTNKVYGTKIIVSESTLEQVPDVFLVRPLDKLLVKGKQKPVVIYELISERITAGELELEIVDKFVKALALYRKRAFKDALSVFRHILRVAPDDGPSHEYVRRCREFIANPPQRRWSGVHTLLTK
jgi:adenylate cyclase